jgi:HEAT repeat protein
LPRLLETFRNPREDLEVRYSAIEALGVMGDAAQSIIPSLVEAVQDPKEHLFFRIKTLSVLVELGRGRPEVVAALGEVLRNADEPPFFRVKTVQALAEMKSQARIIQPILEELLNRELPEELRQAVRETRHALSEPAGKKADIG